MQHTDGVLLPVLEVDIIIEDPKDAHLRQTYSSLGMLSPDSLLSGHIKKSKVAQCSSDIEDQVAWIYENVWSGMSRLIPAVPIGLIPIARGILTTFII